MLFSGKSKWWAQQTAQHRERECTHKWNQWNASLTRSRSIRADQRLTRWAVNTVAKGSTPHTTGWRTAFRCFWVTTCVDLSVPISPLCEKHAWMLYTWRAGIAQLVECSTQKPGTILMQVQVPSAAKDFSHTVNFQCRLSYGVCAAPVCNRMRQCLHAR